MSSRHSLGGRGPTGVSLVGLLLVVAVLGVLTTTTIVGLKSINGRASGGPAASAVAASNLAGGMSQTDSPSVAGVRTGLACNATADGARSAGNLYYAAHGGEYPQRWSDLTTEPALLALPKGAVVSRANPRELDGPGWKLMISGGAASSPTFVCR